MPPMSGHSDRSKRVETSVHVYRLRLAPLAEGAVVFAWDYPGSTLLRVRILRASAGPAPATGPDVARGLTGAPGGAAHAPQPQPEPAPDAPWQIVYDGDTGSFRDRGLPAASAWRYAVFARDGDGPWALWRDEIVTLP
jgi:hypothetical protein